MSEHSLPMSRSSSTTSSSLIARSRAYSVSVIPSGTTTPLPPARPDCLTTSGAPNPSTQLHAASNAPRLNVAWRGPGIPNSSARPRAKDLFASSWARWRVGPNTFTPTDVNASLRPAARGTSGPTTTRSIRSPTHHDETASTSSGSRSTRLPGVPPFPGATNNSPHDGDREIASANACSRPPEPTTRMRRPLMPTLDRTGSWNVAYQFLWDRNP